MIEFHIHGGSANVNYFLQEISKLENLKFADKGEFLSRGYQNGKYKMIELE